MQETCAVAASPNPSRSASKYHSVAGWIAASMSLQSVPGVTFTGGVRSPQSSPSVSFMQALAESFGAAPG